MTNSNTTDTRLRAAGVPQSAIDRIAPELDGPMAWNPDKYMFEQFPGPQPPDNRIQQIQDEPMKGIRI